MSMPTSPHLNPAPLPAPHDCVLCGRCLEVCPLFAATGREELSPRAKFHLLARMARNDPALREKPASDLAGLCLSCGRCQKACPLGLCAPDAVGALRAAHPGWPAFLWEQWITRAGLVWPLAVSLGRLAGHPTSASTGPLGRARAALAALDPGHASPSWLVPTRFDTTCAGRRVALFRGCVASHARTDWSRAAVSLLRGVGVTLLDDPGFACCGAPLGHAGLPDAQNAARQKNIQAWRETGRPALAVFCASCHHGLSAYPPALFAPGEADVWQKSILPLAALLGQTTFEKTPEAPTAILYHAPCHAPPGDPDAALLSRALDQPLAQGPTPCCGFGGLMQLTAPTLATRTAAACWRTHNPPPQAHVLTACSGCATQLAATSPPTVTAGHWLAVVRCEEARGDGEEAPP
ncbi:4Fe-4S dicluster domain-containing protein [Desulfolutivibrio sulfoxidireducens]|nr:4Fe-4S dicluster domain-containing protein [Desulfolutivibrio sulfoxidireducens]